MKNIFNDNIIVISIGVVIILFRNYLAAKTIASQNALWGFNFGAREIIATKFVIVLVGILFIVIGIVSLFGIVKTKGL